MTKRWLLLLAGLTLAFCAAAFDVDFENGKLGAINDGVRPPAVSASDASEVDCSIARSGRCALRTNVRIASDYFSYGAYRVEWDLMTQPQLRYGQGDSFKYSFSILVPDSWEFDGREYVDIVWQFKGFDRRPDGFVAIKGDQLVLRSLDHLQVVLVPRLRTSVWIDVRLQIRWSADEMGQIEYWARMQGDSNPATSGVTRGKNLRSQEPKAGYVKFGLYKPGLPPKRTWLYHSIVHDAIKIDQIN
jgi:hypothetical protein